MPSEIHTETRRQRSRRGHDGKSRDGEERFIDKLSARNGWRCDPSVVNSVLLTGKNMAPSGVEANLRVLRLSSSDSALARRLFDVMADVFEESREPLRDEYVERLLARSDFWALAALAGEEVVGGLTAHTLPMTRSESSEIFIYDVAVRSSHQRRGVGRALFRELRALARAEGISVLFVPADDEDVHAIEFYRAVGGVSSRVTFFTFDEAQ